MFLLEISFGFPVFWNYVVRYESIISMIYDYWRMYAFYNSDDDCPSE